MAAIKVCSLLLLLFSIILIVEGSGKEVIVPSAQRVMSSSPLFSQDEREERVKKKRWRRRMIGSTKPICTYNECRGCRYRCRAEQVPVEGNDPINSAYHYRCVCHR